MTYLLSTETFLWQATHEGAYPGADSPDAEQKAAAAARRWAKRIQSDRIYLSALTLGELRIIRNGSRGNLALQYQLDALIDSLTHAWDNRILDITKRDMYHWANIYDSLDTESDVELEDTFIISQALTHGLTFVGRRSSTITSLELIGLTFVDPLEWAEQTTR